MAAICCWQIAGSLRLLFALMIRRRNSPDGLPFRCYQRIGKLVTTWRYKHHDSTNEILAKARNSDKDALTKARREAIEKANTINEGIPQESSMQKLFDDYFEWQDGLPRDSERRKADSTLAGNSQEAKPFLKVFGKMEPDAITVQHLYKYQDLREQAGAGLSCNKELALASVVFEFGRMRGRCEKNPARGIKRVPTRPSTRRVDFNEIEFLLTQARSMGPMQTLMALAAKTAWLTLRRPPEILGLTTFAIMDEGIRFVAAKRKKGQAERSVTMRWSDELRATINEALTIKRHKNAKTSMIFGNLEGQRYSKSGWGANWRKMMSTIKAKHPEFQHFTLQDCRPGGVTEKKSKGDLDTQDATMHADSRMVEQVYDRRRDRSADPAR